MKEQWKSEFWRTSISPVIPGKTVYQEPGQHQEKKSATFGTGTKCAGWKNWNCFTDNTGTWGRWIYEQNIVFVRCWLGIKKKNKEKKAEVWELFQRKETEKWKYNPQFINLRKKKKIKKKERPRELQTSQSHLCANHDHEADPPRSYAKAHGKQRSDCW